MKILVIGDPHGSEKVKKIPISKIKPDIILIPGDIGKADLVRKFYFKNLERERTIPHIFEETRNVVTNRIVVDYSQK